MLLRTGSLAAQEYGDCTTENTEDTETRVHRRDAGTRRNEGLTDRIVGHCTDLGHAELMVAAWRANNSVKHLKTAPPRPEGTRKWRAAIQAKSAYADYVLVH